MLNNDELKLTIDEIELYQLYLQKHGKTISLDSLILDNIKKYLQFLIDDLMSGHYYSVTFQNNYLIVKDVIGQMLASFDSKENIINNFKANEDQTLNQLEKFAKETIGR